MTLVLTGYRVILREAGPEDAAYLHGLRTDPTLAAHLSPPPPSVAAQRHWLEGYAARAAAGIERYFVIHRRDDGRPCGAVRLYRIDRAASTFTWGSWILDDAKPPMAALDSAVRVYRHAFDDLGLTRAVFDVRADNARTLAFHDRFGAQRTGTDGRDVFFMLDAAAARPILEQHERVLAAPR
jgi:RimJ/RimL family protein N-acetyltransferase